MVARNIPMRTLHCELAAYTFKKVNFVQYQGKSQGQAPAIELYGRIHDRWPRIVTRQWVRRSASLVNHDCGIKEFSIYNGCRFELDATTSQNNAGRVQLPRYKLRLFRRHYENCGSTELTGR